MVVALPGRGLASHTFSPDGKSVLAVQPDGTVTGWDLATGRVRTWHDPDRNRLTPALRSPDGRYRLTLVGTGPGGIAIADGSPLAKVRAAMQLQDSHTNTTREVEVGVGGVRAVEFSPDGATAAFVHTSTADGAPNPRSFVKLLRLADGTITGTYPVGGGPLAFTPDGGTLAAATADGKIHLIDLARGTVAEPFTAGTSLDEDRRKNVVAVRFTKDGGRLVVQLGNVNHTLSMWDWRAAKPVTDEPIPNLFAKPDPHLSPDGRYRIRTPGPVSGTVEVIDLTAKPPEVASPRRVP